MQTSLWAPNTHERPRKRLRWSLPMLLILVVLVNAILGVVLFSLRSPSGPPTTATVPELPRQISELQRRIAEGHPGEPYVLDLSDADLTAAAGYYAARAPDVPFTRIQLAIADERVEVDAVSRNLAVPVPVHATVTMTAVSGSPRAQVEDVRVAGSSLPDFARDQALKEANASLDLSRYELPVTVEAVDLRPGKLAVQGHLR